MEYTTLGDTGTTVSRLCLGCMSFGSSHDWMLDREEGEELVKRAIELGINFFDTANVYSAGESESILGDVLAEYDRDELVVATKVRFPGATEHENAEGLSRKTIEQELENSLDRLGMDTVDLYQIHRWDYDTPIEQTLRALDDAVRRGKVRYLGASSMWAHQFAEALHTADRLGLERFRTMQNLYNLAYREEEREMLPLCAKEDVGVMPWSPLGAGYLTRPHEEFDATTRGEHEDDLGRPYKQGGGVEINERVQELADEKGVSMAQLSMAWLLHKDVVTTPILGTSSVEHLEAAVEAFDVDLSDSEIEYLEEPYEPVPVSGHE
ncbi:Predicted oxidoreductase [Halogranum amylolyticum]|uniref:Predicted oxidoreductase n=1 Tax=Halogranum amylolyticum TaxID=660520 RepID=A0A1H8W8A9_9EURY|nr:aldo/keto reductase [Halogranum amylolyticum]SEP23870.1 Predicted oxidoreductase [Halogranum amylolyticum]